ncbi:MAG: DUF2061 domain-containing protein [Flavobacteriales bacterium]
MNKGDIDIKKQIPKKKLQKSVKIHVYKTVSYRLLGSFTTFLLSYLFFQDDKNAIEKATGVAILEAGLKMIIYYLHERLWYRAIYKLDREEESE